MSTQAEKKLLTRDERLVIWALIGLCALNVPFWAVYEQQGNTMQTWADKNTIWPSIGHFQIPTSWFQSFNPLMIMLLTPVVNMVWDVSVQARDGAKHRLQDGDRLAHPRRVVHRHGVGVRRLSAKTAKEASSGRSLRRW